MTKGHVRAGVMIALVAGIAAGGFVLKHAAVVHMRHYSGFHDVERLSCYQCHGLATNRLSWGKPRAHHDAPAGLVVSSDGRTLFAALDDRDQVALIDTASREVRQRLRVRGGPHGLALDPSGTHLYVTCKEEDRVAILNWAAGVESASVPVGIAPTGITYVECEGGGRVVVCNSLSDDISILALEPPRELVRLSAGREPYAVTAAGPGRAIVANRLATAPAPDAPPSAEVTLVNVTQGRVRSRLRLESAHLPEGAVWVEDRSQALVPLVRVRNLVPITQVANGWVMSSGLGLVDYQRGTVVQVPLDEANAYFADPSGIVVDPVRRRAFVASGGSDFVSVVDLDRLDHWLSSVPPEVQADAIDDLTLSPAFVIGRIPTGRNPKQMVLSPEGRTLYVAERLDDTILMIDAVKLEPAGRIRLGDGGLDDPIRRGERVFTKAAFTFQKQFSCRSCHPDGHVDGLTYDFDGDGIGDNMLDNRSLQGIAGTAPFKWNGKNTSLEVQCGPRFARVLMRTDPFPPEELKDLTRFLEALPPPRIGARDGRLTPVQERGRALFFATRRSDGQEIPTQQRCHTCHRPPLYTIALATAVGTKGQRDQSDLFDTPHLLGIAASSPYLHDGRAATLEEIWTIHNPEDLHGVTSYMNKIQLNELIEFLRTL